MDTAPENIKRRVLPRWMTESEDRSRAQAAKPKKRRKAEAQPKNKCSSRTVTVYCMNEAELVGMALSVLNSDLGCKETKNNIFLKEQREEPAKSPMVSSKVTEVSLKETACSSPRDGSGSQDEEEDPLKFEL
uniref:Cell cycle regulator of non-homologous end joining isoform X2 n=1 Tax=Geotrypetes seraphini TaxID=260995 RepID=A0A6P8RNQ3_GEOSA|nr:cell cycle regulator of non-homologous end joining isoform X2 [Geotrypetes seraphini]